VSGVQPVAGSQTPDFSSVPGSQWHSATPIGATQVVRFASTHGLGTQGSLGPPSVAPPSVGGRAASRAVEWCEQAATSRSGASSNLMERDGSEAPAGWGAIVRAVRAIRKDYGTAIRFVRFLLNDESFRADERRSVNRAAARIGD
jgi:hypothetical protein